jgi:predicted DNA-binding antitoxin AbrB/MazE fold protein
MQLLTNSMPLKEGEELILEIRGKEKKEVVPAKRGWRDAQRDADKDAEKNSKRAKAVAAPKA